jgi:DNA-directed RNA polymerase subunit RPC12/RpoP
MPVAGYRFFRCDECGHEFKERTRDHMTASLETCPECNNECFPHAREPHPEWPVTSSGNLIGAD